MKLLKNIIVRCAKYAFLLLKRFSLFVEYFDCKGSAICAYNVSIFFLERDCWRLCDAPRLSIFLRDFVCLLDVPWLMFRCMRENNQFRNRFNWEWFTVFNFLTGRFCIRKILCNSSNSGANALYDATGFSLLFQCWKVVVVYANRKKVSKETRSFWSTYVASCTTSVCRVLNNVTSAWTVVFRPQAVVTNQEQTERLLLISRAEV